MYFGLPPRDLASGYCLVTVRANKRIDMDAISGLDIRWGRPVKVWGQFEAGLGGVKILTSLTLILDMVRRYGTPCLV